MQTGELYIGNVAVNNAGRDLTMGRMGNYYSRIRLDDLAIYDRALSADEIWRLYNEGCTPEPVQEEVAYRFGFQGQEKDDEWHGVKGTSLAFEYRMHDPRVGRFLSIDPLAGKYPFYSPYAFSGNRVIDMVELEGLEPTEPPGTDGEIRQAPSQQYPDGDDLNWVSIDGGWVGTPGDKAVEVNPTVGQVIVKGLWDFDRSLSGNSSDPTNKARNDNEGGISYVDKNNAWGPGSFRSSGNGDIKESDGSYLPGTAGAGTAGPAQGRHRLLEGLKGPFEALEKGDAMLDNGNSGTVERTVTQNSKPPGSPGGIVSEYDVDSVKNQYDIKVPGGYRTVWSNRGDTIIEKYEVIGPGRTSKPNDK